MKNEYIKKLSIIGKIIYYLHIAKFWKDGDTASFLWNLWNPLSWIVIILLFLGTILVYGISGIKEMQGIKLSKYWKKHKDDREFF